MLHSTLIDISSDGNVFLNNKGIAMADKLFAVYKDKNMGSNMIKWIVCVEDYKSIYNRLPMSVREEQAMMDIFGKKNSYCVHKKVKLAREEYRKFDYDPLIAQYQGMLEKANDIMNIYNGLKPDEKNLSDIMKLETEMERSAISRKKIRDMIIASSQEKKNILGRDEDDLSFQEKMLERKNKLSQGEE